MSKFLHEHDDFKDLIEITSNDLNIKDPALIEKDYWIMHVLWVAPSGPALIAHNESDLYRFPLLFQGVNSNFPE